MNLIPEKDERDVLIYAFRYSIGRMSFAPHTIVEILKKNWDMLSHADKLLFQREIREEAARDNLGMDCDKNEWLSILDLQVGKLK